MKQYTIDELRPSDHEKIKAYMDENFGSSGVDGLYWIPVKEDLLGVVQRQHTDCQPFSFAAELAPDQLTCELLVRTRGRLRCDCIQYATEKQRNWLVATVDAIFESLGIIT